MHDWGRPNKQRVPGRRTSTRTGKDLSRAASASGLGVVPSLVCTLSIKPNSVVWRRYAVLASVGGRWGMRAARENAKFQPLDAATDVKPRFGQYWIRCGVGSESVGRPASWATNTLYRYQARHPEPIRVFEGSGHKGSVLVAALVGSAVFARCRCLLFWNLSAQDSEQ
jgi:hypothetical protein